MDDKKESLALSTCNLTDKCFSSWAIFFSGTFSNSLIYSRITLFQHVTSNYISYQSNIIARLRRCAQFDYNRAVCDLAIFDSVVLFHIIISIGIIKGAQLHCAHT